MAVSARQSLPRSLFIFAVSLFWTIFVGVRMLWSIFKQGPRRYFRIARRPVRPEELDDEKYGTHGYARLKRIRLHYVAAGSEDKPLMLFVHGFPEFWYSWRYQLEEFSKDYRAVAMDMRGYGESEKPHGVTNYSLDKLVDDIKELIPALGYEKCILVGHDWGGAVTWAFAHMYPDMVDRVVVCNCPCLPAIDKFVSSNFAQFMRSWYIYFFQMPWIPEALFQSEDLKILERMIGRVKGINEDDIEVFKYTFHSKGAFTGPMNYYRSSFQYESPLYYPTDKIKVPSLMIWGTNDQALGKELAELTGEYVDNYRVHYIEGASHWVQQDRPQEVNDVIRQYIQE